MAESKKNMLFKKKVKKVVIIHRPGLEKALKLAGELASWLEEKNISVYAHPERKFKIGKKLAKSYTPKTQVDMAIVIGGDGTYLEAVRLVNGHATPIVGINLGSLGFLTETRSEDIYKTITLALTGKLEMRPRSLIKLKIKKNGNLAKTINALNDVVIERGQRSHLIFLGIYNDKQKVSDVKADGLIISSPTGSTAYNLSAGGPILHPEVSAFVVTPICPHSLTNRPIIFPDNCKLSFKLQTGNHNQKASITVDGKTLGEISAKDEILIEKNKKNHYVLKKPSHNYFNLLNEKLKFGERN